MKSNGSGLDALRVSELLIWEGMMRLSHFMIDMA